VLSEGQTARFDAQSHEHNFFRWTIDSAAKQNAKDRRLGEPHASVANLIA
jgi:hypothetical protein